MFVLGSIATQLPQQMEVPRRYGDAEPKFKTLPRWKKSCVRPALDYRLSYWAGSSMLLLYYGSTVRWVDTVRNSEVHQPPPSHPIYYTAGVPLTHILQSHVCVVLFRCKDCASIAAVERRCLAVLNYVHEAAWTWDLHSRICKFSWIALPDGSQNGMICTKSGEVAPAAQVPRPDESMRHMLSGLGHRTVV